MTSIGKGDFAPLLGWLRTNVHSKGSIADTDTILSQATGAPLGTAAFKAHLETPLPVGVRGEPMLDLRPNCECCDKDLPNGAPDALICTFECTFCADCANGRLGGAVPELRRRPGEAADPAGAHAGQASGLDQTGEQGPRACKQVA